MLLDLGNLSKGMGKMFIREFMETSTRTTYDEGWYLFRKGEAATHFYTLIQGEIILSIGGDERQIFKVRQTGDSFGWSSLVGGQRYTATAVCMSPSEILCFEGYRLVSLLDGHPQCGFIFYRKIAEMLGSRLIESYNILEEEEIHSYHNPNFSSAQVDNAP